MPDHSTPDDDHRRAGGQVPPRRHRYVGRRRAAAPGWHRAPELLAGPRRIALVAAAVAAVLIGTGALAQTLPFRPILLSPGARAPAADRPGELAPAEPPAGATEPGTAPPATSTPADSSGAAPLLPAPPETAVPASPEPTSDPAVSEPPPPEPVTVVYEAEDADLSGFVRLFGVLDASGGDVVGMIGLSLSNHVRFSEVTVDAAGTYELTLYYISAPDRRGMVSINDGEPVTVDFPGLGDGRTVGSVSLPVDLAAGPNSVWFGNDQGPAPALDRITVTG